MISNRQFFLQYVAQTSDFPQMLEIERAEGIWLYDPDGKRYADMVSGVSVSNLGHGHPDIVNAVKVQADKHMHLMVYGEFIQSPQVQLARLLAEHLPESLSCTYFVNSGSEAIDGALKLVKRYTGRFEVVSFKNAYHGGTAGALSIMGDERLKNAFRPLVPGVKLLDFNDFEALDRINHKTACVVMEPIQAEAGIILPEQGFLEKVRHKCNETGSLLILDEVQTASGRTGTLFAFESYGIIPDILVLAKSLGGGMPLGAFIASSEIQSVLRNNPALGHITTFGGHPVSCAAGLAALKVLTEDKSILEGVIRKGNLFRKKLVHSKIKEIRGKGLLLAVELQNPEQVSIFMKIALEQGIISDQFLFCNSAFRISPPLTITEEEIVEICEIILKVLDKS
ncbi:MAG: aspartate aminotransferase family protein [Bacteroidales bacterium]|nr:aspartate aminotransferase family protein [Bacteroidales bacterium]